MALTRSLDAKVVLLGDSGVGKTSLIVRYIQGEFNADSKPTIGASFWTKRLILDAQKVTLQIWDTAGQERFSAMAPMYYRGAHAAVLVLDITSRASYERMKHWVDELSRNVSLDVISLVVAANKSDLTQGRVVSSAEISEYAQRIGAQTFDTSAKSNSGVEALFLHLARAVVSKADSDRVDGDGSVDLDAQSKDVTEPPDGCSC